MGPYFIPPCYRPLSPPPFHCIAHATKEGASNCTFSVGDLAWLLIVHEFWRTALAGMVSLAGGGAVVGGRTVFNELPEHSKLGLPRCLFTPHKPNFSRHTHLIKGVYNQVGA